MTSTSQAWWWFIMTQDFHFLFFIKNLSLIKKYLIFQNELTFTQFKRFTSFVIAFFMSVYDNHQQFCLVIN